MGCATTPRMTRRRCSPRWSGRRSSGEAGESMRQAGFDPTIFGSGGDRSMARVRRAFRRGQGACVGSAPLTMRPFLALAILTLTSLPAAAQGSNPHRDSLIARAKALELNTPYVPPPGNALEHHAAGFAQIMCSAVFISGLDPDFAAENVGYVTAPYAERAKLGKPIIDRAGKAVHVTLPNGVRRTAKFLGDQGCVTLPMGRTSFDFKPIRFASALPAPATQAWPMGDLLPADSLPPELDTAAIRAAVDTAFQPAAGMTAAFVVTWKVRIIGERYGEGITAHTPLESLSMGKSLTATLMGILIKQGIYALEQPAPIPEWQCRNDPP